MAVGFRADIAGHQLRSGLTWRRLTAEHSGDGLGNRHFNTECGGAANDFAGGRYAFGHVPEIAGDVMQRAAFGQQQADTAVARQIAGAGEQ